MAAPQMPAAIAAPGLIIRSQINLGENERSIQFEGYIDRDSDQSEINHLCDKMVRAGDRLRAKHVLPKLYRTLEDAEHMLNGNKKRLAELEAGLVAMDEARDAKALELNGRLSEQINAARDAHVESGRRAEFKPPAAVTANITTQLSQLAEHKAKDHAEADIQRLQLKDEIEKWERLGENSVYRCKTLIAEYEALAADGPVNDR